MPTVPFIPALPAPQLLEIDIHDVDHGACIVLTSPSGQRLMLDCGQSISRPWFPSVSFAGQTINTLLLMNLDEDHVEDLAGLCNRTRILAIGSNPTVSAAALEVMKANGMRQGVTTARNIISALGPGFRGQWQDALGGIHWHAFWNRYGLDFTDTNNLSLAVFVKYGSFTALFGGDLESAGWSRLLLIPAFRNRLREVNLFVASHHGRENGKCAELFNWCQPNLTVFSDGPKEFETQETTNWYAQRTTGIPDFSKSVGVYGNPKRYVMTTRKDGTIQVDVDLNGRWNVSTTPRTTSWLDLPRLSDFLQSASPWKKVG